MSWKERSRRKEIGREGEKIKTFDPCMRTIFCQNNSIKREQK